MNKILILIASFLVAFSLSSCSLLMNTGNSNSDPSDNFSFTNKIFSSIVEANSWIYSNIVYKTDMANYGVSDYWASPEETMSRMSGDCEDHAILLLVIMKKQFGIKAELVIEDYNNSDVGHAYVKVDDQHYYDPTFGTFSNTFMYSNVNLRYFKTYDETMSICYGSHQPIF